MYLRNEAYTLYCRHVYMLEFSVRPITKQLTKYNRSIEIASLKFPIAFVLASTIVAVNGSYVSIN